MNINRDAEAQQLFAAIDASLDSHGVVILPPLDVFETLALMRLAGKVFPVIMLDPWYNKGIGGVRPDYTQFITRLMHEAGSLGDHIYLWGFPEIVAMFVERIPQNLRLTAWLTWYYKNNPSVIRGWRSSQMACLHLSKPDAKLYPEHFLNEKQLDKQKKGKLRYMPGPTSVIESALLTGFVGRKEQTGHPSQKPVFVYSQLIKMVTREGDIILDPMCGSGTTGEAARQNNRQAILCDHSDEYTKIVEKRLDLRRLPTTSETIRALLKRYGHLLSTQEPLLDIN